MEYISADQADGNELAELRASTMKPSLVALDRFNEIRVRSRFLEKCESNDTVKVIENGELLGLYVVREREDYLFLDHLYIKIAHLSKNRGKAIIDVIVEAEKFKSLPVHLRALRGSRANNFYIKNGFKKLIMANLIFTMNIQLTTNKALLPKSLAALALRKVRR
jgi:hypothetical protein